MSESIFDESDDAAVIDESDGAANIIDESDGAALIDESDGAALIAAPLSEVSVDQGSQDIIETLDNHRIITPPLFVTNSQEYQEGEDREGEDHHETHVDDEPAILPPAKTICSSELGDADTHKNAELFVDRIHVRNPAEKRKLIFHSETFEKTRFKDIIGHGAIKLRIEEMLLPLALPQSIASSVLTGIRALPASILLYGPPGCGKVGIWNF